MSNLSDGPDALDELGARVRNLGATRAELGWSAALHSLVDELPAAHDRLAHVGRMAACAANQARALLHAAQPACQSPAATADAEALAARLEAQAVHPELGVGEARAALAEAVDALRHQAGLVRAQSNVLINIAKAPDCQDLSGQVIQKAADIISHTEQHLRQLLALSEGKALAAPATSQLLGPQVANLAVAQEDVDDLLVANIPAARNHVGGGQPCSSSSARSMPPDSIEIIACSRTAGLPW